MGVKDQQPTNIKAKSANSGKWISDSAPNWVKDGFNEMKKAGKSSQEAISRLKTSKFCKDEYFAM
ncbi:MAG: hypothetical protein GW898_09150 [Thiomicrospira sp.]|nr:hypothetical protein [Thiomicrospira sp.]NCN67708.1 hypothetical protein [Thiomicrospira sp.]NCO14523.1 hypothetical protein [Thiomicrospira sp.]NCO81014.1 hypothetical protein [Thiomicrospira sp.]OIP95584.1 MAG: hypothetical protein AUK56_04880 [Thiomicrospira sp. CG2_30_44_34]